MKLGFKKDHGVKHERNLPPYHSLHISEIEAELKTSVSSGLTDEEVNTRREIYGFNQIPESGKKKTFVIFLQQFYNTPTLILFAAAVITMSIKDWAAAFTIVAVIVFNSLISFVQEYRAEATMSSLRKVSSSTAKVVRNDGLVSSVPSRDLVPGDVIIVSAGDRVPSDARIVEDFNFEVDESTLTGESLSVCKSRHAIVGDNVPLADRVNMIYMGTSATNGRTKAIVTAIGENTEVGAISTAIKIESQREGKTPLQKQLSKLYVFLLILALFLIILVFTVSKFVITPNVALYAVSLGIAIIPESLVAVVTLTLSLGVKQMSKSRALVRNLAAMVFIGAATDICSDKTGTLTQGRMTVSSVIVYGEEERTVKRSDLSESAKFLDSKGVEVSVASLSLGSKKLIECASMCNNATLNKIRYDGPQDRRESHTHKPKKHKSALKRLIPKFIRKKYHHYSKKSPPKASSLVVTDGEWVASGSPTEIALLGFSIIVGISKSRMSDPVNGKYIVEVEYPFDSTIKTMSVLVREKAPKDFTSFAVKNASGSASLSRACALPVPPVTSPHKVDSAANDVSQGPKEEDKDVRVRIQIDGEDNQSSLLVPGVADDASSAPDPLSNSLEKPPEENVPEAPLEDPPVTKIADDKPQLDDDGSSEEVKIPAPEPSTLIGPDGNPLPDIVVFSKGSVENILSSCTARWDPKTQSFAKFGDIEDKKKTTEEVTSQVDALASRGLRVIAFAFKKLPPVLVRESIGNSLKAKSQSATIKQPVQRSASQDDTLSEESLYHGVASESLFKDVPRNVVECDLTFLGLIGIYDPPRLESANSVGECHRAGIAVRMLTGDHPTTAESIARLVGILGADHPVGIGKDNVSINDRVVWTGVDFDALTDRQVDTLPHLPLVISRCTPSTKVKLVSAIKRRGGIVAMTGDGVNDSPSLKGAHIGIAMGKLGSDVAKEASDMILTDDNFATIVTAVAQGRRIFANLLKFISHLMITNVGEIIALVLGLLIIDPQGFSVYPVSPLHLLFMNMITSSPPAMALGVEPSRKYQMISSKYRGGNIFKKEIIIDMLFYGTIIGLLTLGTFIYVIKVMSGSGQIGYGCNSYYPAPVISGGIIYGECDSVYRARSAAFITLTYLTLYQSFVCRNRLQTTWHWHKTQKANYALIMCAIFGFAIVIPIVYIPSVAGYLFKSKPISLEWILVAVSLVIYVILTEIYKFVLRTLEARQGLSRIDTTAEFFLENPR